jgi:D-aminopeptidase
VQSVTGKKPDGEQPAAFSAASSPAAPTMPDVEAMLAEAIANPEPPKPLQISRPALRSEYQNEIQARVANFRAHQQRFLKERQDYCSTTMAKVQKALNNLPPPPRPGK